MHRPMKRREWWLAKWNHVVCSTFAIIHLRLSEDNITALARFVISISNSSTIMTMAVPTAAPHQIPHSQSLRSCSLQENASEWLLA